jgi:general stress protein YciG
MITPEQRKARASLGGKALRPEQRSFSQNRELAREAGRKGGLTPRRTTVKLTTAEINTLATEVLAKVPQGA